MSLLVRYIVVVCAFLAFASMPAVAADHADAPILISTGRHDARITDLHAFSRGERLILAVSTNPTIPAEVTDYVFPGDLVLRVAIDNDSMVTFDDAEDLAELGGTIVKPARIREDVTFEVRFDRGRPRLRCKGLGGRARRSIEFFAGLRDDPFIRSNRDGRNVASVVIDVPLAAVQRGRAPLLVWATSHVPEVNGRVADHAGRALRSQFDLALNELHPSRVTAELGVAPDVVIFDPSRPAAFPNGRALEDDVVDVVLGPESPDANDVPFLEEFPYLAPPQLP